MKTLSNIWLSEQLILLLHLLELHTPFTDITLLETFDHDVMMLSSDKWTILSNNYYNSIEAKQFQKIKCKNLCFEH